MRDGVAQRYLQMSPSILDSYAMKFLKLTFSFAVLIYLFLMKSVLMLNVQVMLSIL